MRKNFFSGIDFFTVNFILLHTFTMKFVSYQFPDIHLLEEDHRRYFQHTHLFTFSFSSEENNSA